ncbi:unnamed protein product, partial [Polarella glacialis]
MGCGGSNASQGVSKLQVAPAPEANPCPEASKPITSSADESPPLESEQKTSAEVSEEKASLATLAEPSRTPASQAVTENFSLSAEVSPRADAFAGGFPAVPTK